MNPKELVKSFYESNFYKDEKVLKKYLHPECEILWSSSDGFINLKYEDVINHGKKVSVSYKSLRTDISHLIAEDNSVTIRYTYYVVTFENPDEEICLAHFISIWELKDDLLYKCYEMSQLADENAIDNNAYAAMKFSKEIDKF
ncbi:MAG: nuclear transport factor 2 family protein [Flavobacteriaceae bacterium]